MKPPLFMVKKLREYLDVLADSREEQIRIWNGEAGITLDYIETICGLFDDSGFDFAVEEGKAYSFLGEELTVLLLSIGDITDRINPDLAPMELANLPEMERIRHLAQEALKNPLLTSQ